MMARIYSHMEQGDSLEHGATVVGVVKVATSMKKLGWFYVLEGT